MEENREITVRANAKINLGLDIIGKREDGYHLLRMVMQSVDLCDTLSFSVISSPEIVLNTDCGSIPTGEDNLVYRAISLVRERYEIEKGVHVNIVKRIPVAAGLAGGSSDAAAAIHAMNRLFDLSMSDEEKAGLGLRIGADVPFCLMGGTALSEGIGEKLKALSPIPDCHILLVKPEFSISTKDAYRAADMIEISSHPDIDGIVSAIGNNDLGGICSRLGNVLWMVSQSKYPEIGRIRKMMLDHGAAGSMMSGSGPTVFGIFEHKQDAMRAFDAFRQGEYRMNTFLTQPV